MRVKKSGKVAEVYCSGSLITILDFGHVKIAYPNWMLEEV